jgi:hypothetical protein
MSRHIRTHRSGILAAAGLLVTASLTLPSIGLAQSAVPEHALMNRFSVGSRIPSAPRALLSAPADPAGDSALIGERALLGRTPSASWSTRFEWGAVPVPRRELVIDGEAALLGKRD